MTQNQIAYWQHLNDLEHWKRQDAETVRHNEAVEQETVRHNAMQESLTERDVSEKARHNVSTEKLTKDDLQEKARANRASEANYAEKNRIKELEVDVKREDVLERVRHNSASEKLTQAELNEKIRAALVNEGLAEKNYRVNEFKIKEAAKVARAKLKLEESKLKWETAPITASTTEEFENTEEYAKETINHKDSQFNLAEWKTLTDKGEETTKQKAIEIAEKLGFDRIVDLGLDDLMKARLKMVEERNGSFKLMYGDKVFAKSSSSNTKQLKQEITAARERAYSKAKKSGKTTKKTITSRKGFE